MDSILDSTKRILGLSADYTPFDVDIITHINAAFSTLNQLGVGQENGFFIEDNTANWDDFDVPDNQMNMVKSYIYLKTKSLFDPPTTSFLVASTQQQLAEFEWRLNLFREDALAGVPAPPQQIILDGGGP